MALIGRVHPDCVNAANPYHECTENCLRKIAEGNGRKNKNKKKSGSLLDIPILGGRKDRSRPKTQDFDNLSDRSIVYPYDAKSSSNKDKVKVENVSVYDDPISEKPKPVSQPRHVEERENGKTVDPSLFPGKLNIENGSALDDPIFGRRKPPFQEKPQKFDNGSDQGAVNPSGPTLDDLIFRQKRQESEPELQEELENVPAMKLENGDYTSYSGPLTEVKDPSLNKQIQSFGVVPTAGTNKMTPSLSLPTHNGGVGITDLGSDNRSFSFSGTPHVFEESDDEDERSITSDSSVSVGKYRVKGSLASILQSVFEKYGDIAASCQLESIVIRSYYLECVCYVIQELKRTSVKQLTKSKVKEMSAMLKDVESSGMDVAWLRLMLNECAESIEIMNQHRAFEVAKANCDHDIEAAKKELESQMTALAVKEREVTDAKKQVSATRAHLRELELKSSSLAEAVDKMKSKAESLQSKPLFDKVL